MLLSCPLTWSVCISTQSKICLYFCICRMHDVEQKDRLKQWRNQFLWFHMLLVSLSYMHFRNSFLSCIFNKESDDYKDKNELLVLKFSYLVFIVKDLPNVLIYGSWICLWYSFKGWLNFMMICILPSNMETLLIRVISYNVVGFRIDSSFWNNNRGNAHLPIIVPLILF